MVLQKLLTDDPISFYWMGFIMADGWVSSRVDVNGNQVNHIGMMLQNTDVEHLQKFLEWIGLPPTYIRFRTRDTNFKKHAESVDVCITDHISVPLIKAKFGISNRKTYSPPDMRRYAFHTNHFLALIIGFIDGDGSINLRAPHKPHISIQTTKQWADNLDFMNLVIHQFCGERVRNKVNFNNRGHATLSICKRMVVAKLKQFTEDYKLPVLNRKWDVIDNTELTKTLEIDNGARYTLVSPNGYVFQNIKSLSKFCHEHEINAHKFNTTTLDGGGICDGWKVSVISPIKRKPRDGKKYTLEKDAILYTTTNLKKFCRTNKLEYHKMLKLCNENKPYLGWKVLNA